MENCGRWQPKMLNNFPEKADRHAGPQGCCFGLRQVQDPRSCWESRLGLPLVVAVSSSCDLWTKPPPLPMFAIDGEHCIPHFVECEAVNGFARKSVLWRRRGMRGFQVVLLLGVGRGRQSWSNSSLRRGHGEESLYPNPLISYPEGAELYIFQSAGWFSSRPSAQTELVLGTESRLPNGLPKKEIDRMINVSVAAAGAAPWGGRALVHLRVTRGGACGALDAAPTARCSETVGHPA